MLIFLMFIPYLQLDKIKKQKAEALVDYTDSHREIKGLLESIKKINPTAYKKYNLTLYDDVSR